MRQINKQHLKALTGIRFFAAIYVVLFHLGSEFDFPKPFRNLLQYGYIAVSFFFVLSGFIMAYNYLDYKNESSVPYAKFWLARFVRIYPVYLLSLILSLPAFFHNIRVEFTGQMTIVQASVIGAFTITLLQAWTPWTVTQWNWPGWTLSAEAFFYLVFPFIAIYINRLSNKKIMFLIILLWFAALIVPIIYLISQLDELPTIGNSPTLRFIYYTPLFHLPQFLIGVGGGIIFLRKFSIQGVTSLENSRILFPVKIASIMTVAILTTIPGIPQGLLNNGLLAPLFVLIVYALAHKKGLAVKILSLRFITILGEVSYAIYILQIPLYGWTSFFNKRLGFIEQGSSKFVIVYIFLLLLFSTLVFYILENPAKKFLKKWALNIFNSLEV